MKDLGIDKLLPGPPDGLQNSIWFMYDGKECTCPSDELLPFIRGIAQLKLLKDKKESKAANLMSFGDAIITLKSSKKVARKGWNGKGMWLELQVPDTYSKMSLPYIYMKTADGHLVPWLASQTDILSDDWEIVNDKD